jgi:hypothetical protein
MPSAAITTRTVELLEAVLPYRAASLDDTDDQLEAAIGVGQGIRLVGPGGGGAVETASSSSSNNGSQNSLDDIAGRTQGTQRSARLRRSVPSISLPMWGRTFLSNRRPGPACFKLRPCDSRMMCRNDS